MTLTIDAREAGETNAALITIVDAVVDAIQVDLGDPSVRANAGTIEAMLGNPDTAGVTVYAGQAGTVNAVNRAKGKSQKAATTINLNQVAATYTLFTGTTQAVILEKLVFRMPNVDIVTGATLTSISIHTDDVTPAVIISAAEGVLAVLEEEATLSWDGQILIPVGTLIQLTIAGAAAGVACTCDVMAESRAVVNLGYLA